MRAVERRADPLLALFRPAEEWAAAETLLAVAWDRLIAELNAEVGAERATELA